MIPSCVLALSISCSALAFQVQEPAAIEQRPEPEKKLEELFTARELQKYRTEVKYKDRMEVFTDVLKRFSQLLRGQVEKKTIDDLLDTLDTLQSLSHHALKEPMPANKKELRSGEVRKLEIRIRKLIEDIEDAKSIAAYEYRVEFDESIDDLAQLRDQLLQNMFGDAAKKREDGSEPNDNMMQFQFAPSSGRAQETRYSTEISGDKFTDEEFTKIKDNQELRKRVDIFLKIAEDRLAEISRRMNNEEWKPSGKGKGKDKDKDKEEVNPLEFFTLEEMVHAYERALNSAMINIDEKAKYKLEKEKDVRKTLEKLNKKINEFAPRLAPIKELAIKNKDQVLYREITRAEKTTEIARKGSAYGLGAPVQ